MDTWIIGKDSPEQVSRYLAQQISSSAATIFCFDYFDTLIVRDIEPEYTKQLAAHLLSQILDHAVSSKDLYGIRRELEKKLCEESAAAGGELEFYLAGFSRHYFLILQEKAGFQPAFLDEDRFVQLMLDIEVAVELAVQLPCKDTVEVLRQLKAGRQTTVLISDFYLPGTHFKKLLNHFQLAGLFDHIYISSDHAMAKGSGRLYAKICADLDCDPGQMIMIGDNSHADVAMAREQGLSTIHLQNPKQKELYSQWQPQNLYLDKRVEQRFFKASCATGPFREMEYSLWYFIWLLFQRLVQQKVRDVFFFSKEGEFLKKLFDRFQQDLFGHVIVKSHYILVSRKATFLASLRPLEKEDFSRLFAHYRDISLRDFLLSLNLEESVAAGICEELDLDFQTRFSDLQSRPEFIALRQSRLFQEVYEKRRQQQRQNFILYLDSFDIDYRQHGLNIVDVGWKGSIQDNLYHILEGRVRVQGFFIGSLIATEKKKNNLKTGLLFDDTPALSPYFHVYNNNRSLFEMVLGASHGSADGYFTRQQYEQLPGDHQRTVQESVPVQEGELCIATLDFPKERELYQNIIRPLQDQIYETMILLDRAYIKSGCSLPGQEWFARQHARMVFTPGKKEVDFFERLYHLENFGIFEYANFRAGGKLSILQRLNNLRRVIKSKDLLESGIWPPIILRRLGVGFYRYVDGQRRFHRVFRQR